MKKLLSFLVILSLGVFTLGCEAQPGDVGTGDEGEVESIDTDLGEGEDMLDDEPGEGELDAVEEVDLDPGAGEDIGDTEPNEIVPDDAGEPADVEAGDEAAIDLDPGAGDELGVEEPEETP